MNLSASLLEEARGYRDRDDLRARACGLLTRLALGEDPAVAKDIDPAVVALVNQVIDRGQHAAPVDCWLAASTALRARKRATFKRFSRWLRSSQSPVIEREGHWCCTRGSVEPSTDPGLPGGRLTATAFLGLARVTLWTPSGWTWRR